MKRLFSVLFVVCAVCIFPKLSLAAGDDVVTCTSFCQGCTNCEAVLKGNCNCGDKEVSYCELAVDNLNGDCTAYSNNEWPDLEVTCNCASSGGNTPSTSTTCTVRFCLDDNNNNCTNKPVASSSHESGESLVTPSYENWKNAGGDPQSGKILKGWSKVLEPEEEDILAPGEAATISCNSGDKLFYHPVWGDCDAGKYADKVECKPCTAGHYCTNGEEHACPAGKYSLGGLVVECSPVDANCYTPWTGSTSSCPYSCTLNSSGPGGSTSISNCKCNAGFGGNAGVADGSCTKCAAGYFKGSAGNVPCDPCGTGTYQGLEGQTKCEDCDGEGEYTTNCAVTDDYKGCETCETCPAGYKCETGLTYECKNYTYSSAGMLNCINVSTGYYADDCEPGGKLCKKQVQCGAGSYCKDSKKFPVSAGHYAIGCGTNHTSDCVGEDANCKGCTGETICPAGYYCTGGKKIAVLSGRYATQCSGTTVDSSKNCIGNDCQGCQWYETCPAINGKIGYYCTSGQKKVCGDGYYLASCKDDGSTGCKECKSCPDGTTFAGSVVLGVGNCGLQTCEAYYNEAKGTTGVDWDEWSEKWSMCPPGGEWAGCFMAPTKKYESEESMEVDGKGTNPKCCDTGKFGQCYYKSNRKSCIAECTGCTGGTQGGGCTADQMKLTDKHTCPGEQTINPPSDCTATVSCTCRYNDNLTLCSSYLNNATNGGDVCYQNENGKDRTDYCETFCYKECDNSPCTQRCTDIKGKTGVKGCTDKEDKYPGRQFKNNSECKYYDNGVPGTAPYCSVDITCKENYHTPRTTGCTPCLEGYHTKDDNKEENCTPNVYKVTLNRGDQITNGTSEFFYKYKTKDDCYYYSNYNSTNGIVSGCLDVVDGKQTVQKPTRKGYTFAGYYTAANGEGTQYVDKDGKITKDIYKELGNKTLYAKWTPNVYKVTLNPAPGSGGTSNYFYQYETKGKCYYYTSEDLSTCIEGTGGVQIVKPEREGYTFDGYYTAENGGGTQYVNENGTTIGSIYKTIGDKTLYAKWTANVFTVKFNRNDGATGDAAPESKTCTYDQACTAATQNTMRKTNHVFKGWDKEKNGNGDEIRASGDITNIISQGEITLYAIWEECDACVQSTGSKCKLTVVDNECTYESGCIDGYTVVERTKDTNKPECTANEYSAIYFCGEGGGTPDPESDPVRFNEPYTVDISHRECSKPGSLFLGWEGKNNEDTIFAPYNVETEFTWAEVEDITFTAQWEDCPAGYYCGDGRVEQKECPVGSTTGGGADNITQCFLLGGQSQICSKIGNEEPECFTLPAGVKVNYSGVEQWIAPAR